MSKYLEQPKRQRPGQDIGLELWRVSRYDPQSAVSYAAQGHDWMIGTYDKYKNRCNRDGRTNEEDWQRQPGKEGLRYGGPRRPVIEQQKHHH